ncbi:GDI interacting protein 3 isoform X2 [Colletes latitarsis]|uniref:GDI interacting protein 3 isoform X2 n=1 Tax=Colletes latitarsis TaxID=2605962 RepID=UPI00403641D0
MADKIKEFFQKKKLNAKFMNAGKGYKLTDSTSSSARTSTSRPIERVEPTQEVKVAGLATLARLEAKTSNANKCNNSYAAIKAQVKQELEQEKRKTNEKSEKKTQDTIEDNSVLAVTGVYFRCPYLSNEILSKDEWRKKIKVFLYEQLKGEEAGLTACLVIQSCNTGREKINNCIETLGKYLENIINNPESEKYRKIRTHNRIFQDKVLPIEGALDFLNAAGFRQKKLMNNDVEEDFLVWDPENCNIEDLTMLNEALRSAEPIPLELDRNLQVLLPVAASKRIELPQNFFNLTAEQIKKEQQLRTEDVERNQMLRTKRMREKDAEERHRKYKFSLIRIKFPDDIILQGTFSVNEKYINVVEFVHENLANSERLFCLKRLAGETFNDECFDKTLLELELFPTVLLVFALKGKSEGSSESTRYLKEELLSYVQTF